MKTKLLKKSLWKDKRFIDIVKNFKVHGDTMRVNREIEMRLRRHERDPYFVVKQRCTCTCTCGARL